MRHWGNLASAMKGSFGSPVPGTLLDVDVSRREVVDIVHEDVSRGRELEGHARGNFRVVVVCPTVVERLDLAVETPGAGGKIARRWVWTCEDQNYEEGVQAVRRKKRHGHNHKLGLKKNPYYNSTHFIDCYKFNYLSVMAQNHNTLLLKKYYKYLNIKFYFLVFIL
jgi:hypothetical protein